MFFVFVIEEVRINDELTLKAESDPKYVEFKKWLEDNGTIYKSV